jgi:proline iminopeptidase
MLVCHPGGPGVSGTYFGNLPELASRRTLVVLDPRGTGRSDRPQDSSSYRLEDYAADLEVLRESLELEHLDLLGHSHGGFVAIVWASAYPDSVGRLVLANTLARFHGEAGDEANRARAGEPWYEDAVEAREYRLSGAGRMAGDGELGELFGRELPFYFNAWGEDEQRFAAQLVREGRNGDAMRFFNGEIAPSFDLRARLERITSPALVITGADDFVAGEEAAREVVAGLGDARLAVLPDSGHFSFAESNTAARFGESVVGFLDEESAPRRVRGAD